MEARSCGTCRHYEPSTLWRRGWCRNSLLFSPSQSHSVQDNELDCSRGTGDFWQPRMGTGDLSAETTGQANVNAPKRSPLKLFAPALSRPALATAGGVGGGTMMFARGGDDDGYDYPDDDLDQPPARSTRRVVRSDRTGVDSGGGGRQRSIQFQPEERYWTDYLRIALPIIGLLLMVGLFWYWATQLIDDSAGPDEPVATAEAPGLAAVDETESTPAPTAPPAGANNGQSPTAGATQPPAEETPVNEENEPEESPPPEGAAEGAAFAPNDAAVITEDGVNMRSQPTTAEENVVAELSATTIVEIQSGPTEADGFNWWEVVVSETGESGWVAEDFLEAAE